MRRLVALGLRHAPWLITGAVFLCAIVLVPSLRQPGYWLVQGRQYFAPTALALALLPIMLTGGIDLSVGSAAVLASVVIGALWQGAGWPIEAAIVGGVAAGLCVGLVNAGLVTVGVFPLVATLATRELYRGLAFTLSGDRPVDRFPPEPREFWQTPILGLPPALVGVFVLTLLTYLVVHHTWVGRCLYAIGDNETAARFAGVPVGRLKVGLYAWSGLVAGFCGAGFVMQYGAAKADVEKSLELTAIACVILGGVRVTGGAGSVLGTVLGILTVVTLLSALGLVFANWRETLLGALVILVAIANEAAARWQTRHLAQDAGKAAG